MLDYRYSFCYFINRIYKIYWEEVVINGSEEESEEESNEKESSKEESNKEKGSKEKKEKISSLI